MTSWHLVNLFLFQVFLTHAAACPSSSSRAFGVPIFPETPHHYPPQMCQAIPPAALLSTWPALWHPIQTFRVTFKDSLALSHILLSLTQAIPLNSWYPQCGGPWGWKNLSLNPSPASYQVNLDELFYASGPWVLHMVQYHHLFHKVVRCQQAFTFKHLAQQ